MKRSASRIKDEEERVIHHRGQKKVLMRIKPSEELPGTSHQKHSTERSLKGSNKGNGDNHV